MRPQKLARGPEHGLAGRPPDRNRAAVADARGDVDKRVVRVRIGNSVGMARAGTGAQAFQREDAGFDRGLVHGAYECVDINMGFEICGVLDDEMWQGVPLQYATSRPCPDPRAPQVRRAARSFSIVRLKRRVLEARRFDIAQTRKIVERQFESALLVQLRHENDIGKRNLIPDAITAHPALCG